MTLKEFFVKATLEYDPKEYENFNNQVKKAGDNFKRMSVAIGAAVGTLFGLSKVTSMNARELDINARALGLNVERLQELEYAAQQTSKVSRGELQGALESLSSTLHSVRMGNIDAAHSFAQLQIGSATLADENLRADQVLAMVAERLRQVQDPIRKAALAQEIFGGAGAKLIPLLDQGAAGIAKLGKEARNVGAVLDRGAIQRGVEFDRTLDKMLTTLKGVVFTVGTELMKAFGPAVKQLQMFVAQNRKLIAIKVKEFVSGLVVFLKMMFTVLGFVIERIQVWVKVFGGLERTMKTVGWAMGLFFGAKMISSIGAMVMALKPLSVIMGMLSIKALAIGAAVAALFLVIEDLVVFMQGGNSVFGQMLEGIGPAFNKIGEMMIQGFIVVEEWFIGLFTDVIPNLIAGLPETISNAIKSVGDFGSKAAEKTGSFLSGVGGKAMEYASAIGADMIAPFTGGGNQTTNSQNNSINAPITVTVPPGTSPAAATATVSKGVEDGFSAVLRQTRNNFVGGVAR